MSLTKNFTVTLDKSEVSLFTKLRLQKPLRNKIDLYFQKHCGNSELILTISEMEEICDSLSDLLMSEGVTESGEVSAYGRYIDDIISQFSIFYDCLEE